MASALISNETSATRTPAQLFNHLQQAFREADSEDKRNQVKDISAHIYANALRSDDVSNWALVNNYQPFRDLATAADVSKNTQAIASAIYQKSATAINALAPDNVYKELAIYTSKLANDPFVNVKIARDMLQSGRDAVVHAVQHDFPITLSSDERLRLANLYDLPYTERITAMHGEHLTDALALGSAAKAFMSAPDLKLNATTSYAKKGLEHAKEAIDNLPALQPANSLVLIGAEAGGSMPWGTAMTSIPWIVPKNNPVAQLGEFKANRDLAFGMRVWEQAKKEMLYETYVDIRSAKNFLNHLSGKSNHEIRNDFSQEGYINTSARYNTLFYDLETGGHPPPPANTDIPDLAADYLLAHLKAKQNEISYHVAEAAKQAFPGAIAYRSANNLPLPDPILHPWEHQAAGKFYTEIADSMFRAEMRINRDSAVTRIPINEYLPNEPFAKTIIVVEKTSDSREVYFVENEFEIVGNFTNSPTPTKNSAYTRINEAQAIMLTDHLIEIAIEKNVRNANNPHYESELPFTLKMAEKLHSVIKPEDLSTGRDDPLEP